MNIIALDTETTGVLWKDVPFAVSMWGPDIPPWEDNYYDWRPWKPDFYHDGERIRCIEVIDWYIKEGYEFVFHNAKFDLRMLGKIGLDFSNNVIHDTHCLAHLLDEHQAKGLKPLARLHLGENTDEETVLKVVRKELGVTKDQGYYPIPRHVIKPYAIKDAEFTYRLFKKFFPLVQANDDLYTLYQREMELTRILMEIEDQGIGLDLKYIDGMMDDLGTTIMHLNDEIVAEMSKCPELVKPYGKRVIRIPVPNPNSGDQVATYFAWKGIELENTQADTLATIDDPLARKIVELRKASKLRTTYFSNMKLEQVDGVLHPNFRQYGTVTGRMSSGTANV